MLLNKIMIAVPIMLIMLFTIGQELVLIIKMHYLLQPKRKTQQKLIKYISFIKNIEMGVRL